MGDFSNPPGASPHLLALIESLGWPLTKASYIAAMFFPQKPDLPVSAGILGQVPRELPGRIPRSLKDVSFRIPAEQMKLAETRLPEPLIERTMKAYGFSRAEAIGKSRNSDSSPRAAAPEPRHHEP